MGFEDNNTNDIQAQTGHSSKHRGPDGEDEDRRGEMGLRKLNVNAIELNVFTALFYSLATR